MKILELGFGTGLNALLTLAYNRFYNCKISYTGIDKYPLGTNIASKLNFSNQLIINDIQYLINAMHELTNVNNLALQSNFILSRRKIDFNQIDMRHRYDLIYHDAFSPDIDSQYWELPFLQKLFGILNPGGRLVTYCAKGQFKRDLKSAGFIVSCPVGPIGKREITVAEKK